MEKILSPMQLWQDFDPTKEALESDILKIEESGGITTQYLYFTGRSFGENRKSRVFAAVCYKNTDSVKPAALIVDEPCKAVDAAELRYWAENGFVAMSIDFAGQKEKGLFTLYPEDVAYANLFVSGEAEDDLITDTARETKRYEYALCAMRAVTFLIEEKKVKSVSVITVGNGVKVGMMVLGIDKRISNGAIVFGNLEESISSADDGDDIADDLENADEQLLRDLLADDEKSQIRTVGLAVQSYLPLVTVPLYVICAGNSGSVNVISLSRSYYRTNDLSRLLILPTVIDFLPCVYAQCIVKWCKGKTVTDDLEIGLAPKRDGRICLKLSAGKATDKLSLWYCRDAEGNGKNWIRAELKAEEDGYFAVLDVYENGKDMLAFALADGEIAVSTVLTEFRAEGVTKFKQPTALLYSGESEIEFIPLNTTGKWHGQESTVSKCKGYLDITGTKSRAIATFAVSDISANHSARDALSFDICCSVKEKLYVYAVSGFGKENKVYRAAEDLTGDGKWQKITLEEAAFHRIEDGRMLSKNDKIDLFCFVAEESFIINNIYLV